MASTMEVNTIGTMTSCRLINPEVTLSEENSNLKILPVYPLTAGISQNEMRKWHRKALELTSDREDYLPLHIRKRNNLCSLDYAYENIHFPEGRSSYLQAKYRLAFDELFLLQTALLGIRKRNITQTGISFKKGIEEEYIRTFPFELTSGQKQAIKEISSDMEKPAVMNRLLQGDVGSGKTAVAETAMFKAVKSGYQAVLMAPTEVLARQHYQGISARFEAFGINTVFLGGKMGASEKQTVSEMISDGTAHVVIGTHAVIQDNITFNNLGLVITDEQHRFGVNQRSSLTKKGEYPDRIVMTATPIPRTLAAILYGDLDISVIKTMPIGRKPVITAGLTDKNRNIALNMLKEELSKGHQGYIVTPLIEESEHIDAISVNEAYEEIKEELKGYETAMLHGDMRQDEKDRIMEAFHRNEINVLVSTVVIEVGINVPNATVMIIESSERFGLAQLHQLRGRVGRGEEQSFCYLINRGKTETSKERTAIMETSTDGFYIAEMDLKLRGPGEIFGVRQHGIPEFKIADISKHQDILFASGDEARLITDDDRWYEREENLLLKEKITEMYGNLFLPDI